MSGFQLTLGECNPPKEQDRANDLLEHFNKFGYVMFPQQRIIYNFIAKKVRFSKVLEAGSGNGTGAAMLEREASSVIGSDLLKRNVEFARAIYPWLCFFTWDVTKPWIGDISFDYVVAVELFEHVADPVEALHNLLQPARKGLWLTTPNGEGKKRPPDNPYHVCEYTLDELEQMLLDVKASLVEIYSYRDQMVLPIGARNVDEHDNPLIFHLKKGQSWPS